MKRAIVLFAVIVSVLGALLIASFTEVTLAMHRQDERITATCRFYLLLSTLKVPASPAPGAPAIELVEDSREAYTGLGCGRLPRASSQLDRWARYYHVPEE